MSSESPEKKLSADIVTLRFFALIFSLFLNEFISYIAEKDLRETEDVIAFTFPLLASLSLPLGFFTFGFLWIMINRFCRKEKDIADTAMLGQLHEKEKRRSSLLLKIFIVIGLTVSLVLMFFGVSAKTVITDDYTVKNYGITGELKSKHGYDELKFIKIYPVAEYWRYGGFEEMHAYVELYISSDDCMSFGIEEFKEFSDIVKLKEMTEQSGIKVYVQKRASNDPDPEWDNLSEDEIKHLEEFYAQYDMLT
ncbi:MAG: hypothetical protein IKJ27_02750 [Clostridia bacterium]|nr:hypothetical protein [Clostridia bacterium]